MQDAECRLQEMQKCKNAKCRMREKENLSFN